MIFGSQPPYPCVQNRTHSFEWNNPISMKSLKLFNLSAGVTNKFPLLWLLTRAQRQNRNLGIVLPLLLLSFFFYSTRSSLFEHFFCVFFFSRLSLLFMLLFGNFRPVFVRKQMPADWSQPSIDVANVTCNHLSSHDCIRNLPDSLEIVKKRTKWKKNVSKR